VPNSSGFRIVTTGGFGDVHLGDISSAGRCNLIRKFGVNERKWPVTGIGFHRDDPNNMICVCFDGSISRLDLREKSSTRLLMVNGILVLFI
jgi:hypothetical protein